MIKAHVAKRGWLLPRLDRRRKKKTRVKKTRKNVYIRNRRREVDIMLLKITTNQHIVTRLRLPVFVTNSSVYFLK